MPATETRPATTNTDDREPYPAPDGMYWAYERCRWVLHVSLDWGCDFDADGRPYDRKSGAYI